ncbi:MAG: D-alanyl-D-alanine carboxypeptidase [Pelagibacteraceae bacterium]|nr:MAG: D-alanyl-D-alanine carboxypeptidase [Pelagibacteraceae bacterium]
MFKIIYLIFFFNLLFTSFANSNIEIQAKSAILQDFLSGEILFEKEPDQIIYPASMTKIMTAVIAFDLIQSGSLSLNDKFVVSNNAGKLSERGNSAMFIEVGDEVSVSDLLKGIIIVSGNDAAVAIAEGIAGTEEQFAVLMTNKAKEIGMNNTNFSNSSGIEDENNYSTVRDILLLSKYLITKHPDFYKLFSEKELIWHRTGGDPIAQNNRNPLLYKNLGADGIKTGYLSKEKYSLASSIIINGRRLIAVGSGFESPKIRSEESEKIFNYGLNNFDLIEIAKSNKTAFNVDVWLGKEASVDTHVKEDIYKSIDKGKKNLLKVSINYTGPIEAPIIKDQKLAKLRLIYDQQIIGEYDLLASKDVKKLNFISRLIKSLNFIIWGDV